MSEQNESNEQNSFLNNFDGYVLIFCAIILSALKVVELILKKKQNNNFTHLNTFESDLKKLQNDFVELSRIQTTDLSPELKKDNERLEEQATLSRDAQASKRFAALDAKASSKSMANIIKK